MIRQLNGYLIKVWLEPGWVFWTWGLLCCTLLGGALSCPLPLALFPRKQIGASWETWVIPMYGWYEGLEVPILSFHI